MDEKNSFISVDIMGVSYRLKRTEDDDYLKRIAAELDSRMRAAASKSPVVSSDRIAVLAALRMCDEFFKEKEDSRLKNSRLEAVIRELSESLKHALREDA